MTAAAGTTLTVEVREVDRASGLGALGEEWSNLDSVAGQSFFTSWGWIGPWLRTLPPSCHPTLIAATVDGRTVGLAIAVSTTVRRRRVITSRTVALNTTGVPELDSVALEYNDMLVDPAVATALGGRSVREAMADALYRRCASAWEEVVIPYSVHPLLPAPSGRRIRAHVKEHESPFVDLGRVRESGGLLALVSKNRRAQIRKARRELEALGPLTIEVATTPDEGREALASLSRLHQARWTGRGERGAFADRYANDLHHAIVEAGVSGGAVQLCTIRAGSTLIGHSYNFVHGGRVVNYQNGFDFGLLGSGGAPGYVCHLLGIEMNAELGHLSYDFLAGDEDYKRRLATGVNPMSSVVYQRWRPKFAAEDHARRLKHRLDRVRSGMGSEPGA